MAEGQRFGSQHEFARRRRWWPTTKSSNGCWTNGITFEQVVVAVEAGGLVDVLEHPNPRKYPNQRILVVTWDGYVYLVPYVEEAAHYFLKTVIPSRKATRDFLKPGEPDVEA